MAETRYAGSSIGTSRRARCGWQSSHPQTSSTSPPRGTHSKLDQTGWCKDNIRCRHAQRRKRRFRRVRPVRDRPVRRRRRRSRGNRPAPVRHTRLRGHRSCHVGAAVSGGASVTGSGGTTPGNPGATGNASRFGNLYCAGGSLGGARSATTALGGNSPFGVAGAGGAGANVAAGAAGNSVNPGSLGSTGGPSGGGIMSGGIAQAGAAGLYSYLDAGAVGGPGGVVSGSSPTQGTVLAVADGSIGPSAGSGGASVTGAAQDGANALPNTGDGGAGGGASLNGNASGQGGSSGSGWVLVISYFQ